MWVVFFWGGTVLKLFYKYFLGCAKLFKEMDLENNSEMSTNDSHKCKQFI